MKLLKLPILSGTALFLQTSASPAAQNPSKSARTNVPCFSAVNHAATSWSHDPASLNPTAAKVTKNLLSKIVVLHPQVGRLTFHFSAAWQKEPGRFKNETEVRDYLERVIVRLNNPIELSL